LQGECTFSEQPLLLACSLLTLPSEINMSLSPPYNPSCTHHLQALLPL
jgi:hypothetical protein